MISDFSILYSQISIPTSTGMQKLNTAEFFSNDA
jgi:hypothetical protein